LTLLKPQQCYTETKWQIWIESVYKFGFYTGFEPPDTGFDPRVLTHPVIKEIDPNKSSQWYSEASCQIWSE
jgi:hypothetical protein